MTGIREIFQSESMLKIRSGSKISVLTGKPGENYCLSRIDINKMLARIVNEPENNPKLTYP